MNKSCLFWIMWTFLQLSVIHLEEVDTTLLKMMLLIGSVSSILLSVFFYKKEVQMSLKQNIEKEMRTLSMRVKMGGMFSDQYYKDHTDRILTLIQKEREEVLSLIEKLSYDVSKYNQAGNQTIRKWCRKFDKIKQTLTGEPNE